MKTIPSPAFSWCSNLFSIRTQQGLYGMDCLMTSFDLALVVMSENSTGGSGNLCAINRNLKGISCPQWLSVIKQFGKDSLSAFSGRMKTQPMTWSRAWPLPPLFRSGVWEWVPPGKRWFSCKIKALLQLWHLFPLLWAGFQDIKIQIKSQSSLCSLPRYIDSE